MGLQIFSLETGGQGSEEQLYRGVRPARPDVRQLLRVPSSENTDGPSQRSIVLIGPPDVRTIDPYYFAGAGRNLAGRNHPRGG